MIISEKPVFSIIIPTLNSSNTIRSCLESIFNQSFLDFEVWIIDGKSTDETISIVMEYGLKFQNIHWISEKDNGIYDAMNKGIKMSNGDWIYFLGSDDLINNNQVLQKVYSLDKSAHEVVYGNARIRGNTVWAKDGDIYDGPFDLHKLLKKNICHQAMFYHKKCFRNKTSLFNSDYTICADWDFNLRCWARKEFLFINLIVVDFFGGGASSLRKANKEFYDDFDKNILLYFGSNIMKNRPNFPELRALTLVQKILSQTKYWVKRTLLHKASI